MTTRTTIITRRRKKNEDIVTADQFEIFDPTQDSRSRFQSF